MRFLQLTALLIGSLATVKAAPAIVPDYITNVTDSVDLERRGPGGWSQVTYPPGSTQASIPIQNGNVELFALGKAGLDKKKLKRVVFVIHGKGRDPWNYYSHMTSALQNAQKAGLVSNVDDVGVWAPGFWCDADEGVWPHSELQARAASNKQMVWHASDWSEGAGTVYPASNNGISSYSALDQVIQYFGDRSIFPNVQTIVLAGHSMGAQMLHRYAMLGNQPSVGPEVHYYIGNPASYFYSDSRRPSQGIGGATSRSGCPTYNEYKYGMEHINRDLGYNSPQPSEASLYGRYSSRFVHYQLGTADHASGTAACEAYTQGDSHFNRGRIYQAYLEMRGYPSRHTVDYISGVGHDDAAMFASSHGQYRLFVENSRQGKTQASAAKHGRSAGLSVTFTSLSQVHNSPY